MVGVNEEEKAQDYTVRNAQNRGEEKGGATSEEIKTKMASTNATQGVVCTLFLVHGKGN